MKRKKKLINKKFQLRTTFSILGLKYLVFTVIIAAVSINMASNNRKLTATVERQKNIVATQDNIFKALLSFSRERTWESLKISTGEVAKDIERNRNLLSKNIEAISEISDNNYLLLYVIIGFLIIQGFVLYVVLIRKTHRISGPIYIMSRHMEDIIAGREPEMRSLREKDEFRDFYDLFRKMVETFRKEGFTVEGEDEAQK